MKAFSSETTTTSGLDGRIFTFCDRIDCLRLSELCVSIEQLNDVTTVRVSTRLYNIYLILRSPLASEVFSGAQEIIIIK